MVLFLSGFALALSLSLTGQETSAPEAPTEPREQEEVTVTADPYLAKLSGRLRDAFAAFRDGDYAKAEIEFTFLSQVEVSQGASTRFFLNTFSDARENGTANAGSLAGSASAAANRATDPVGIKGGIAVLHYMKGISEARQSKFGEAKRSLRRAIKADSGHVDARIDLGLIALMTDDKKLALKQIKYLEKVYNRCQKKQKDCGYGEGFKDRFAHLITVYEDATKG